MRRPSARPLREHSYATSPLIGWEGLQQCLSTIYTMCIVWI